MTRRHAAYLCDMALRVTAQEIGPDTLAIEERLRAFYPDLVR